MNRVLLGITLLLLCGCGPTKTTTLQPTQINWSHLDSYYAGFWCDFGIQSTGTGPSYGAWPGYVLSGYEDHYEPGSGTFACVEKNDHYYRGGVLFDVSQFNTIIGANLTFNVASSVWGDGEVTGQNPPLCNATTLGEGSGDWSGGMPFDNPASMPPCGPSLNLDVSSQVRDWITGTHANFGLILAGPKLDFPSDLPEENATSISWYNNFQLVVQYNPADNPRAPQ